MMEAVLSMTMAVERDPALERLRRGHLDELGALIERYQYRLFRYLLRLVRDAAIADDLFQQTWVLVMEKIGKYDARRAFEPWLFSVARNLAIDHLRRVQPASLEEDLVPPADRAPDAFAQLLEHERAELLVRCLETLPVIYREVLSLRFEEEMKLEQIAEVLHVPLPTVKTRLARGLDLLRQKLGGRV